MRKKIRWNEYKEKQTVERNGGALTRHSWDQLKIWFVMFYRAVEWWKWGTWSLLPDRIRNKSYLNLILRAWWELKSVRVCKRLLSRYSEVIEILRRYKVSRNWQLLIHIILALIHSCCIVIFLCGKKKSSVALLLRSVFSLRLRPCGRWLRSVMYLFQLPVVISNSKCRDYTLLDSV